MSKITRPTREQLAQAFPDQKAVRAFETLFKILADTGYALRPGDIVYSGVRSSTVTITIASPGVITWNAHALANNDAIVFSTSGALPTGLTVGTIYYVVTAAVNTFSVSATPGGAAINTTGTQSGTHTAKVSSRPGALPANGAAISRTVFADTFANIGTTYGAGDGSTTFNLPNVAAVSGCPAFVIV